MEDPYQNDNIAEGAYLAMYTHREINGENLLLVETKYGQQNGHNIGK